MNKKLQEINKLLKITNNISNQLFNTAKINKLSFKRVVEIYINKQ